jgi:hypothetical protein
MSHLGKPVLYTCHAEHQTETIKKDGATETKLLGSVHHPEQRTFAGIVTRENEDGSYGLAIFPHGGHGRPGPVYVDDAREGDGEHEFQILTPPRQKKAAEPTA